ncbi:MAG: hypothetical protein HKO95_17125, partial [Rhodobacteraceae bacterium]|nr:hypothetical protein [Paracoccaceae bacterium]
APIRPERAALERTYLRPLPGSAPPPPRPDLNAPITTIATLPGAENAVIHIHAPATVNAEVVNGVAATLTEAGFTVNPPNRVNFAIGSDQIRYYHVEDAVLAARLASAIDAVARDFTNFSPAPAIGTLEIWIAGNAPAVARPQPQSNGGGLDTVIQELRDSLLRSLQAGGSN